MAVSLSQAQSVYSRYRPWIQKYHGGIPAGLLAVVITHESGGNPTATGDPVLQEYGLLQVTPYTAQSFGVDPARRLDPETNVFLGSLRLQTDAVRMYLHDPSRIVLGSADNWKLARLASAIGAGGTRQVISAAGPAPRGNVFEHVRQWALRTGGIQVSAAQDAAKTTARINGVADHWAMGQAISSSYGRPVKLNAPHGLRYTIPADLARYMISPLTSVLLTIGALGAVGALVYYATLRPIGPAAVKG